MDASRQRVRASLAHTEPDRVVVDLGATTSSGISGIAYDRLKTHLGMCSGHTRIFDVIQQLARVEDGLLETFGVDVASIDRQLDQLNSEAADRVAGDVATPVRSGNEDGTPDVRIGLEVDEFGGGAPLLRRHVEFVEIPIEEHLADLLAT